MTKRIQKKRQGLVKWEGILCPYANAKLDKNVADHVHWEPIQTGDNMFEIRSGRQGFGVTLETSLKTGNCSCRQWGLSGIPCPHAVAAILYMEDDPVSYVAHWFRIDTYKKAYAYSMKPLNGETMWVKQPYDTILPPGDRRMPGRPKKCRRKDPSEEKKSSKAKQTKTKHPEVSRKGRIMTCTKCQRPGHNKTTCKASVGESSNHNVSTTVLKHFIMLILICCIYIL